MSVGDECVFCKTTADSIVMLFGVVDRVHGAHGTMLWGPAIKLPHRKQKIDGEMGRHNVTYMENAASFQIGLRFLFKSSDHSAT